MPTDKKEGMKKFAAKLKAASEKVKKIQTAANNADASVDLVEKASK